MRPPFVRRPALADASASSGRHDTFALGSPDTSAGFSALRLPASAAGDLFALLADARDRLADRRLALGERDLQQHAREVRLDLLRHLVGVDLEERLALRDRVALGLQPLRDGAGLHALAEPRELDLGRHRLTSPPCA